MGPEKVRFGLIQISGQDWALMDAYVRDIIGRVEGPSHRYLCGYAAASQWLAGGSELPLRDGRAIASSTAVRVERQLAAHTAYLELGALAGIDTDYARGVWRMLAWATGITNRPPLRLPVS